MQAELAAFAERQMANKVKLEGYHQLKVTHVDCMHGCFVSQGFVLLHTRMHSMRRLHQHETESTSHVPGDVLAS